MPLFLRFPSRLPAQATSLLTMICMLAATSTPFIRAFLATLFIPWLTTKSDRGRMEIRALNLVTPVSTQSTRSRAMPGSGLPASPPTNSTLTTNSLNTRRLRLAVLWLADPDLNLSALATTASTSATCGMFTLLWDDRLQAWPLLLPQSALEFLTMQRPLVPDTEPSKQAIAVSRKLSQQKLKDYLLRTTLIKVKANRLATSRQILIILIMFNQKTCLPISDSYVFFQTKFYYFGYI